MKGMDGTELFNLMDETRKWTLNTEKYKELDYEINRKCRERRGMGYAKL